MSNVKLKRLKINKYRNVRPGTELHFDDGVNLILGQNGSGKTTLQNLLTAVVSNNFSGLEDEAFNLEYQFVNDQHSAQITIENQPQSWSDAQLAGTDNISLAPLAQRNVSYEYKLYLSTGEPSKSLEILGTPHKVAIRHANTQVSDGTPASPFDAGFLIDALSNAGLETTSLFYHPLLAIHSGVVPRFDESLDCFLAMTGRPPVLSTLGSPQVTRLRLRQPNSSGQAFISFLQFAPWRLAQVIQTAHNNPAGEISLDLNDEPPSSDVRFLYDAAQILGMHSAALKPEIQSITGPAHTRVFEVQGFSFNFTRTNNATIIHDLLSYGQKRLLTFFYYLASTRGFVIADELVNGLHHRWIEACMKAIGERQAFLTSQNPLLFEYVEFDSIEQVQARFITCKTEVVDGAEQLVWQNMPRDDAERFYRGYEAEIESIGDILINRGLW